MTPRTTWMSNFNCRAERRQLPLRLQRRRPGPLQHHPLQASQGRPIPVGHRRLIPGRQHPAQHGG